MGIYSRTLPTDSASYRLQSDVGRCFIPATDGDLGEKSMHDARILRVESVGGSASRTC